MINQKSNSRRPAPTAYAVPEAFPAEDWTCSKGGIKSDNPQATDYGPRSTGNSGVALVAVLAVLTVLAILAATFVTMTSMQSKASDASMQAFRAKLLMESGLQHAISLVQQDTSKKGLLCDSPETDPLILNPKTRNFWHIVKDKKGNPIGRYKFKITDESGKLNVNFLPELAQHVVSNSKKNKKDPRKSPLFSFMNPKIIKKILAYQYGPNRLPGNMGMERYRFESRIFL